jgi:hypothetical protein
MHPIPPHQKTVLFVLAGSLGIKNFLYSPFATQDFSKDNIGVVFVLENADEHKKYIEPSNNLVLENLIAENTSLREKIREKAIDIIYRALNYRFSKIQKLPHFNVLENIPKNYVTDMEDKVKLWMKFPMPNSKLLYKILYSLYNSNILRQQHAKLLIEKYSPQLIICTSAQVPLMRSYCAEARRKNIKTMACVNNWDNLTIRGPVFSYVDEFVVWNRQMEEDLKHVHAVEKPIHCIGMPHLDYSFNPTYVWDRNMLCEKLGLSKERRIVVFGVYNARFGQHEPSIAAHIAKNILSRYNAQLIIRGYPRDETFLDRYERVKNLNNVALIKGHDFSHPQVQGEDDRIILNSLMKNADLVISSGSTLDLEALRFDKPVIDIAFDGDLELPKGASILSRYNMHHHINFLRYNSTYFVKSYAELESSIEKALRCPETLTEDIRKMKRQYLEPLDGKASERLFQLIKNETSI